MAWPGNQVQQMVIAKLVAKKNPPTYDTIRVKSATNRDRERKKERTEGRKKERKRPKESKEVNKEIKKKERTKERKKEGKKERKKERKKDSERASLMPSALGTAGNMATRQHGLNFPHRFCPLCECAQQYLPGPRQV